PLERERELLADDGEGALAKTDAQQRRLRKPLLGDEAVGPRAQHPRPLAGRLDLHLEGHRRAPRRWRRPCPRDRRPRRRCQELGERGGDGHANPLWASNQSASALVGELATNTRPEFLKRRCRLHRRVHPVPVFVAANVGERQPPDLAGRLVQHVGAPGSVDDLEGLTDIDHGRR
ncbi:MAG: hypothetical protein ACK559_06035, partial [bacterium]